jgi:hypothetical protein
LVSSLEKLEDGTPKPLTPLAKFAELRQAAERAPLPANVNFLEVMHALDNLERAALNLLAIANAGPWEVKRKKPTGKLNMPRGMSNEPMDYVDALAKALVPVVRLANRLDLPPDEEPDEEWSRPDTIREWAKAFGYGRNKMSRLLKTQTVPNKMLDSRYQVRLKDIPVKPGKQPPKQC